MQKPWLSDPQVTPITRRDAVWEQVRREAEETSAKEPVLASLIYATDPQRAELRGRGLPSLGTAARAFGRRRAVAQDFP